MKKLFGIVLLVAACVLAMWADEARAEAADPTAVQGDQQAITALTQQLNSAAVHDDAAVFQRLLAENYTAKNDAGQTQTKQMIVTATRQHAIKFSSIQTQSMDVQVTGDTAVATDVAVVHGSYQHRPFSGTYGSRRVWEKHDGQWRVVSQTVFDAK